MIILGKPKGEWDSWSDHKVMMKDPTRLFEMLQTYDYSSLNKSLLPKVKARIDNFSPPMTYDSLVKVSKAIGLLGNWIQNWYDAGSAMVEVAVLDKQLAKIDLQLEQKMNEVENKKQKDS